MRLLREPKCKLSVLYPFIAKEVSRRGEAGHFISVSQSVRNASPVAVGTLHIPSRTPDFSFHIFSRLAASCGAAYLSGDAPCKRISGVLQTRWHVSNSSVCWLRGTYLRLVPAAIPVKPLYKCHCCNSSHSSVNCRLLLWLDHSQDSGCAAHGLAPVTQTVGLCFWRSSRIYLLSVSLFVS